MTRPLKHLKFIIKKKQIAKLKQVAKHYKDMYDSAARAGQREKALQASDMHRSILNKLAKAENELKKLTKDDSDKTPGDEPKDLNDFKTILNLSGNDIYDKSYEMISQYDKENPSASDEDKVKFFNDTKDSLEAQLQELHNAGDEQKWDVKKAYEVLEQATEMVENNVYFKKALSNLGDTEDITDKLPKELTRRLKKFYRMYNMPNAQKMATASSKEIIYRYAKDLSEFDSNTLVNYFKAVAPGLKSATLDKIATFGKQ